MTSKRREFIDRLLRISELNQELLEFSDKNRQPAFTKRIKLVQMGKAQFNLPFQPPQSQLPRHNCKILVIDKHTNRYHSQQHNRTKTSELPKSHYETPQSSPSKQESSSVKINFSNRRSSQAITDGQIDICNAMTPMHCELKNQIVRCSDLSKRPNSQYKNSRRVISSAKNIYHCGQGESINLLSPKISVGGILNGKSIKFHKANTMGCDYQRRTQEEKKAKYQRMKEISKNYAGPFVPPPKISAKSYIICEARGDGIKPIACFNSKNSQQVASLTKIMTCIIILQICQRMKANMDEQEVKIGKYESSIGGTTAELRQGQIYTVRQLLYGLMLPSGNDASLALAVWGGRRLLQSTPISQSVRSGTVVLEIQLKKLTKSSCYSRFIREMNEKARILGMSKTKYANSHGLANPNNRSTAYDIAILSHYSMQNSLFREIVSSKTYEATIKFQPTTSKPQLSRYTQQNYKQFEDQDDLEDEQMDSTPTIQCPESPIKYSSKISSSHRSIAVPHVNKISVKWQNTHKLLHSKPAQYVGIKTGITNAAGPCLSSMVQADNRQFIIIVLACSKIGLRFKETQLLKRWLFKHEGISVKVNKISSLKFERQTEQGGSDSEQQWSKQDD